MPHEDEAVRNDRTMNPLDRRIGLVLQTEPPWCGQWLSANEHWHRSSPRIPSLYPKPSEFRQSLKDVPSRCWGCGHWDQDLRLAMIDLPYNLTKWHGLSQFHNIIEQIYSIYYTCIYCNIHQRERSVKGHMYFALSIDSVASESVTYILPVCNLNFF